MYKHRGQGGGWVGAGWGLGGSWVGVGWGLDVRNALQPVVRPLLCCGLCALHYNLIQMSVERPRNSSGVDAASTDGARVSTVASFWTSQRSSVPSTCQHSHWCRRVVGYFYLFGVLPMSRCDKHTTVTIDSIVSLLRSLNWE